LSDAPTAVKADLRSVSAPSIDAQALRGDFPILSRRVHGRRLVYLDNAATTQKPQSMIDALVSYYSKYNANVHRGVHTLAEEATAAFESTRGKVARLIGSRTTQQIVFTRNTTESLNLVAASWGGAHLKEGDEILLTQMEHHSNLVPWMMVARKTGAKVRHLPVTGDGRLDLTQLDSLLTARTKVVSLVHVSNVLGTINPVAEIAERAHGVGALVVVDGAQSVPHMPVDVSDLGADLFAFSAHKMLGPTGVGVLWGRTEILEEMDPYMGGGEMIREVRLDGVTWNELPWKFEAGTPNIADVVAFGAALDYLADLGLEAVRRHEVELTRYALAQLRPLRHLTLYGPTDANARAGVVTFNDADIHPHDLATILDHHGVAVRAGHHCAQPLMRILGAAATARASFYVYNDTDDVDELVTALREARRYFGFANGSAG
jgi:cysteine desulfurase / selenocysteine lyase